MHQYHLINECPNPTGYYYKRTDSKRLVKIPKGCGRWDCPYCGAIKKRRELDRISLFFALARARARFLTLTLGDTAQPERLMWYYHRFIANLLKYGYKFQYYWVKEFMKNGRRHLHVIIDHFIPKNVIVGCWYNATRKTSFVAKINSRTIHNAAGYMFKYMGKELTTAKFKRYERRVGCSRGFRIPEAKKTTSGQWAFAYKPFNKNLHEPLAQHFTIVKRQAAEARKIVAEVFPDIYKRWQADYRRRQECT